MSGVNHTESSLLPRLLRPPVAKEPIADSQEVRRLFSRYRVQILVWTTIGYAGYYFVAKNLSTAMPEMERTLGINKATLGTFLTLHGVLYGVSKFANGFLGDRANARVFMAMGLILSAAFNVAFGFSKTATAMGVFWMLNGYVQGMGYPPCARLMTHWFEPKVLTSRFAIWNTSHSLGAAGVVVLCGYLVTRYGWQSCFFVPAAIAIAVALLLLIFLRDTPESVGLPEVAGTASADDADFAAVLRKKVFGNPYVWLFSLANFFVYVVRYGVLDWGPTVLKEAKGIEIEHGSWMVAGFEVAGLVGILLTGWLTDRFFAGRGSRMLRLVHGDERRVGRALLVRAGEGLCVEHSVPHVGGVFHLRARALIGAMAANLGTKRAAATAVGLTSIFGYASTVLSGYGIGKLVQNHGWDAGFKRS